MSTEVRTGVQGTGRGTGAATLDGAAQAADLRRPARPGRQQRPGRPAVPGRPPNPVRPAGPGRPGRPVRTTGPARHVRHGQQVGAATAARPAGRPAIGAASVRHRGRMSFVLLVLGLLGGGLVCLLVVNTTLAAASIGISRLQQQNAAQLQRVQELRQQVAREQSAAVIEREAVRLGMRPEQVPSFVDLRSGRIAGSR